MATRTSTRSTGASSRTAKKSTKATASKKAATKQSTSAKENKSPFMKLFVDELKDIYWAEKHLTKALPKMAKKATSPELIQAFENHLTETEGQIERLEQVFEMLDMKPAAKKCEAMSGLVKEAEELIKENPAGMVRDAAMITAAQKVEHYEIASYGSLRTFAQMMGMPKAAALLQETLDEEGNTDHKLTEIAEASINEEAIEEEE
jgi:ferritin-like metal-binding protein YciE